MYMYIYMYNMYVCIHEHNVCVVNFWIKSGINSDESLNRDGAKRRIAASMSVFANYTTITQLGASVTHFKSDFLSLP